jgi:signal transduction histidine kinase
MGEPLDARTATDPLTSFCHDLRSHIAAAVMLASEREGDDDLPEAVQHRLALLREQLTVVSSLLTAQLADHAPPRGRTDLAELVRQSARTVSVAHDVAIEVRTKGRPGVQAEPSALQRAVVNVLTNAARASIDGPVIVRVRHERGTALVEVDDDGPGFGEIESGPGLGLRQARHAVQSLRGRLDIGRSSRGGVVVRMVVPAQGLGRSAS